MAKNILEKKEWKKWIKEQKERQKKESVSFQTVTDYVPKKKKE